MIKTVPRKIIPMQVGRTLITTGFRSSLFDEVHMKQKAVCAEPTGKGNLLILDAYFGRMFRSDEGCVRDELDEYCRLYYELCRKLDEDPAHQYYEVLSWNELYSLHGIIPSIAGDSFGYTNTDDYRVELDFDVGLITDGEWVEKLGEPFLCYQPFEWCYPNPCYMEV